MRVVIQRVKSCELSIDNQQYSSIGNGMLVLLGIEESDAFDDLIWLCNKITGLRIFNDPAGVMNLDVREIKGEIMIVSQFTLHASTRKGNRPSYSKAARPIVAKPLYEEFIHTFETIVGHQVARGVFGADMQLALINDGPVTICIDSKNRE